MDGNWKGKYKNESFSGGIMGIFHFKKYPTMILSE